MARYVARIVDDGIPAAPLEALQAAVPIALDGFQVGDVVDLIPAADVVITATGVDHVVGEAALAAAHDGILLGNAGHFDREIDVPALDAATAERIPLGDALERHVLRDGRTVDLIARGRMLNLAGRQPKGNSIESMDLGFAMQARALERVATRHNELPSGAQPVPDDINRSLARAFVAGMPLNAG